METDLDQARLLVGKTEAQMAEVAVLTVAQRFEDLQHAAETWDHLFWSADSDPALQRQIFDALDLKAMHVGDYEFEIQGTLWNGEPVEL